MKRKHQPGCQCCVSPPPPTCKATLCGTVVGCPNDTFFDLGPLPGATVALTWTGGGVTVTTDSAGRYCFDNPATYGVDVAVDYTISYHGLVSATGTLTAQCLSTSDFAPIQLFPDDDHLCVCHCPDPLPKVLHIANSKGTGTATYNGSSRAWIGTISWVETEGATIDTVPTGLGPNCFCAVKATVTTTVQYSLACDSGAWSCTITGAFSGAYPNDSEVNDSNGCYGVTFSICSAHDPANWRSAGRFTSAAPGCGAAASGTLPIACGSPISLTFTFDYYSPIILHCANVTWPTEAPTSVTFTE